VKKTLTALLFSFALTGILIAQAPVGGRHAQNQVQFMAARLSLTTEQQLQATTIFGSAASSESSLHASLRTAQQGLNDAVKSDNTVAMEQLSSTIGNLTTQLTLARSKTRAAFYRILTPEQRTKLDQLESQHPAGFRGRARRGSPENGQ
jgi:Spy/CpxP family protein refolding chaperone